LRRCAFVFFTLLMSVLSAGVAAVSPRTAAAVEPLAISQEIALSGLAIGPMTAHGAHGLLETLFPPPGAPLAASGSFVRVFFSYSPQSAPGSTMVIGVNGHALSTVELDRGHAAGGVLEVSMPTWLIDPQHPNRLQVTFDLATASASQDLLYGKVEGPTLIHYSLVGLSSGLPGLETYPWSLLATDASVAAKPTVGVALPSPPDMAETTSALRIFAELGRRTATQAVRLKVIAPSDLAAPNTEGAGVFVIGRLDHLPAAQRVLAAAGWHSAPDGWTAPDGRLAKADDGLLVTAVSPWDGRTTVLLVSGATNAALAKAASALVDRGTAPLAGAYAIVSAAPRGAGGAASRTVQVVGPDAAEIAMGRGRAYETDLSFVAPPLARDQTAVVSVAVPPLDATARATVAVNGTAITSAALDRSRSTTLTANVPGRLLRPGRNSLAVAVQSELGSGSAGAGGALTASVRLPQLPSKATDLGLLPSPFIDGQPEAVRFLLADVSPGTLTAAAQAAIALGYRSSASPGMFETALLVDPSALAGAENLIVVGSWEAAAPLAGLARGLPQASEGDGEVAETTSGQRTVLWLMGSGDAALKQAVAALYGPDLSGRVATVDTQGKLAVVEPASGRHNAQPAAVPATPGRGAFMVALLILAAAAVLVSFAVVQLLHTRRIAA
jgi:hypothetical protein